MNYLNDNKSEHYLKRWTKRFLGLPVIAVGLLISCNNSPEANNQEPIKKETQSGLASYYHPSLEGEKTASGETFHNKEMVAAHPTYPMGTVVQVTNEENNKTVKVKINDRGPTLINRKEGVIIDLSKSAAQKLDMLDDGRAKVTVDVVKWGNKDADS